MEKSELQQVTEALDLYKRNPKLGKTQEAIAIESGVSYGTLKKISTGETKNPGSESIRKLYEYFSERSNGKR